MEKPKENIESLRNKINEIDKKLIELIAERRKNSKAIIKAKDLANKPIRDKARERALLNRAIEIAKEHGIDPHLITSIYHQIIEDSVRLQQKLIHNIEYDESAQNEIKVAIQGIEGSFSYLTANKFFSDLNTNLTFSFKKTFDEVVHSAESGETNYAFLPIENTTSGGINEVYDLLLHTTLSIIGEEVFHVKHCLLTNGKTELKDIKKIYAHYQAASQCSKFISSLNDVAVEYFADTAMSVQKIKESGESNAAAIASREAAEIFNVHILKEDIANQLNNFTRFIVASRKPIMVDQRVPSKTSLVMATSQSPGSLVEALGIFRKYEINMTKLESRPVLGNPWEEMFYLDFEGNINDKKIKELVEELHKHTRLLKVLGSYPTHKVDKTEVD